MQKRKFNGTENYWMSISDMMSALMIIFLFIAIAFMIKVQQQQDTMNHLIIDYRDVKVNIYNDLYNEFKDDFAKWDAEIDPQTLSIKFQEPEVLFATGSHDINPKFKAILDNFFPRYIAILSQKYGDDIQEIRIEGHTSSEWNGQHETMEAYFKNMELSQARTRSVLEYTIMLPAVTNQKEWLIEKITANGLSYSQRIKENGIENPDKSRRVEFRIRTKAEDTMDELIKDRFK